jgi:hypothetical protein
MRNVRWLLLVGCVSLIAGSASRIRAQDAIPGETLAQLQRLEPLSEPLVKAFVEAKRLTPEQGQLVLSNLSPEGKLNLPLKAPAAPSKSNASAASVPTNQLNPTPSAPTNTSGTSSASNAMTPIPTFRDGTLDVLNWIKQDDPRQPIASANESNRLRGMVRAYRFAGTSERRNIRQELAATGPIANAIVAEFYHDPIDLNLKRRIWRGMSRRENPYLAGYIAATHQALMREANPVLIPYAKDVGGLLFRRRSGNEEPRELFYTSRELREAVVELEESIAHASGIRAVTYLIDVYAARYESDEAPMRDNDRDRKQLIRACGGNEETFDQSKAETWGCSLPPVERLLIAERLVPHLRSKEGEIRRMAANGLLIVLGIADKKLKDRLEDAHEKWSSFEEWWRDLRAKRLAGL